MSENVQLFSARLDEFSSRIELLQAELGKAIYGQETVIRQLLAQLTSLSFKRIQFTPDLMPSDITGTNVIDEPSGKREFRFVPGPVFAHIVLADEINRTPPKTQAALIAAMQERQVTVGQTTYDLPHPFMVAATQNPIEMEGTYPLPEAPLDRFMFSVHIDYPVVAVEERILAEATRGERPPLHEVIDGQGVLAMQRLVEDIVVSRYVVQYAAQLVRATRPHSQEAPKFVSELVEWGAGPRAGQHLVMGAKAMAAMDGRLNVAVQDVKDVALPVLRHRIACNFQAQAEGTDSLQIVQRLLEAVAEPEVPKYA